MAYAAKDISILKGLQPVRERPGMYIGSTGPSGPAPPRLRGRRQLGRRGARGLRDAHRRHAARRRRLPRRRQRARDPGRSAPRVPRQVGGRDRAHDAARRRQVRRRGLQDLRRPARRRRVGRERVVAPARARDRPRRRPLRADVRRRRRARRTARAHRRLGPHGHTVTFWPDGTIMEELEFRAQTLLERLREMAFLNKGLEIVFRDERPDEPVEQIFKFDGGIVDFVVAPQRVQGAAVPAGRVDRRHLRRRRSRDRDAVEQRLLRGHPLVREQHRHHRRRHARRGLQEVAHQRR